MARTTAFSRWADRTILDPLEGLVAHGLYAGLRLLSIDAASALGGAIARTIGPRLSLSRRARRNLALAFPDRPAAEIEAILREAWDNLGRTAMEYPHLARLRAFARDGAPADGRIEIRGLDEVDRALARGRPVIFFTAHLANWEIAPLAALQYGVDLHVVYRPANNPWVDTLLRSGRGAYAGGLVPKGAEGARRMVALLRAGKHLGLLPDQKMNDGVAAPFFGRPAMTAAAPAQLALKFGCTVLPAQVERLGGARFRLTVHPPLALPDSGDRRADALALTTRINAEIESWVRQRPGQWLWLHNRWPD